MGYRINKHLVAPLLDTGFLQALPPNLTLGALPTHAAEGLASDPVSARPCQNHGSYIVSPVSGIKRSCCPTVCPSVLSLFCFVLLFFVTMGGQLRWALCLSGNPPLCVLMLSVLQLYCCIVEN